MKREAEKQIQDKNKLREQVEQQVSETRARSSTMQKEVVELKTIIKELETSGMPSVEQQTKLKAKQEACIDTEIELAVQEEEAKAGQHCHPQ